MATGGTILQVHAIVIQLIMKIFDSFGMKDMIIVPTARNPINPVPNAVRRGVGEASSHHACRRHATEVVIELYKV